MSNHTLNRAGILSSGLAALTCLGLLGACSAEIGEDTNTTGETVLAAKETVLAQIDVGYGVVSFYEHSSADGARLISMDEVAPSNAVRTPVDELFADYGRLTALEVFEALAPERKPPDALVASHAQETAALGRLDASILAVPFQRDATVEKSLASCTNFVFADVGATGDWTNKRTFSVSGLSASSYLVNSQFFTDKNVTVGICNESSVTIQGRRCWRTTAGAALTCQAFVDTSAGFMRRWWNYNIVATSCDPGDLACGLPLLANHRVDGQAPSGRAYILAVASLAPQACTTSAQCTGGQQCRNGICQFIIR